MMEVVGENVKETKRRKEGEEVYDEAHLISLYLLACLPSRSLFFLSVFQKSGLVYPAQTHTIPISIRSQRFTASSPIRRD